MKQPPLADQATRRLVQRAFEEQGYLVIGKNWPTMPEVGSVLDWVTGTREPRRSIPGPMVVIASATREEWQAQRSKYAPGTPDLPPTGEYCFFKVVAE